MAFEVLITEQIHPAGIEVLAGHANVNFAPDTSPDTLEKLIRTADGAIFRTLATCDRALIDAAPRLKVIGRHGVGVDNIDVDYAHSKSIPVVYTPEANSQSVAEHTVGLMLALNRRLAPGDQAVRSGAWKMREQFKGMELSGAQLAVVGAGRIGSRVARICQRGLGMNVNYFDIERKSDMEKEGISFAMPDDLYPQADILTVHIPKNDDTINLIDGRALSMLKSGSLVINAARGGIVDEDALVEALDSGHILGAALDVFSQEPLPLEHPLMRCDNVLFSPHIASNTEDAKRRMSLVTEDILAVLQGRAPKYPVM
ncbi:MAG: hydroxyacid dehydrogenase [Candidatus Latescibacteria bacterium]|nr:hydroxyacid dehydrogenase [Candidatus Latescibacterota bacterium]